MRKPKIAASPKLPDSHLDRIRALNLTVVCYLNESRKVSDGSREWLPRDIVGKDGKTLIVWREADRDYSIAGYNPWHGGMFGGRYAEIHNALAWVECAIDVRAGRRSDFRGV